MKLIMENWKKFITEDKAIDRGVKPMTIKLSFINPDPMKSQEFKILYYNRKFDRFQKELGKIDGYINREKDKRIYVTKVNYEKGQIHKQTAKHIQAMVQQKLGPRAIPEKDLHRFMKKQIPKILKDPDAKIADYENRLARADGYATMAEDFNIVVLKITYM